jgi:hypothetical protein
MSIEKLLFFICIILSLLLFVTGFRETGSWYYYAGMAVYTVIQILFRKKASKVFLVISTGLAAAAIILGADPLFMILYAGLSLVCWDLVSLDNINLKTESKGERFYILERLKSLGIVFITGLVIAFVFSFVRIKISPWLMMLFASAGFFCINQIVYIYRNKKK